MGWTSTFSKGFGTIQDLKTQKLDPPLAKAMPNAQSFVQAVDVAEKMSPELAKLRAQADKAIEDYNKMVAQFDKVDDAVGKNLKTFGKAVADYIKQGREYRDKEYAVGCTGMERGLDDIDKELADIVKKFRPIKT